MQTTSLVSLTTKPVEIAQMLTSRIGKKRLLLSLAAITVCLQTAMAANTKWRHGAITTQGLNDEPKTGPTTDELTGPPNPGAQQNVFGDQSPDEQPQRGLSGCSVPLKPEPNANGVPAENARQVTRKDTPWERLVCEVGAGALLIPAAYVAAELGIKNADIMGNTEVTAALNDTARENADGKLGKFHDLHDVMQLNLEGVDMNDPAVDLAALNGMIWLYILTGALVLAVAIFCIFNGAGMNPGYAAVPAAMVFVGGMISSAGFCANIEAYAADSEFVWSSNAAIWIGVALVALATLSAIVFAIYAAINKYIAPKQVHNI